jgi:N-acetylneuraminic acid mutarotase
VGETYRIHVSVEGTLLGFADVVILDNGKGAQSLKTGETFPLIDNATLAIAFRIEEGAYIAGGTWTWVSGSSSASQVGSYGVQGVPAPSNVPGARQQSGSWTDASGDLLLFGGHGYGAASVGRLNDLWRFDGANWTWISGSSSIDQAGSYGTQGVPAPGNVPGARSSAGSWMDASGDLWLFGGYGFDGTGSAGRLNDLWRFDGANWTWISGSSSINQPGSYGTQGVPAPGNVPGARITAGSWTDASGGLWLFGGWGYVGAGSPGFLNDLWRFDGANWTWISGSSSIDQAGSYGTQGVPAPGNVPGARNIVASWIDTGDNLWLFGGSGYDGAGSYGYLNDLWRFDGAEWTWVSGSSSEDQVGVYGVQGVTAPANVPGARQQTASWIDASGNLWLFGGEGYGAVSLGKLNDLWRFDGANWTWISGSSSINQAGSYGTQGVPAPANVPGARSTAVSWVNSADNLWLFGGSGYGAGSYGYLNDLWLFNPGG